MPEIFLCKFFKRLSRKKQNCQNIICKRFHLLRLVAEKYWSRMTSCKKVVRKKQFAIIFLEWHLQEIVLKDNLQYCQNNYPHRQFAKLSQKKIQSDNSQDLLESTNEQGGRSWQHFGKGKNAHNNFYQLMLVLKIFIRVQAIWRRPLAQLLSPC